MIQIYETFHLRASHSASVMQSAEILAAYAAGYLPPWTSAFFTRSVNVATSSAVSWMCAALAFSSSRVGFRLPGIGMPTYMSAPT